MKKTFLDSDESQGNVPNYISAFYQKFYLNPKYVNIFDSDWFATLSTFGLYPHIKKHLLKHVKPNSWALLAGNSYGWLIKDIAAKITESGYLEVIDPIPLQISQTKNKLSPWPHFKGIVGDIEHYHPEKKYDLIISYFLLHELPDKKKKKVIKNIMALLSYDGKAIFIDYGVANKYHPLKYVIQAYNSIFEPFADTISTTSLKDFINDDTLHFDTKSIFGGLYQQTIITLKKQT